MTRPRDLQDDSIEERLRAIGYNLALLENLMSAIGTNTHALLTPPAALGAVRVLEQTRANVAGLAALPAAIVNRTVSELGAGAQDRFR